MSEKDSNSVIGDEIEDEVDKVIDQGGKFNKEVEHENDYEIDTESTYNSNNNNNNNDNEYVKSDIELQVPIYIETLTGTTFELQVLPNDTIKSIKNKLQHYEGIPISRQHLIWNGKELNDNLTVHDYGINFGTILKLILKVRGGPIDKSLSPTLSPLDNEQFEFEIITTEENFSVYDSESRPVTVLILNNDDQIQMYTIPSSQQQTHSPSNSNSSNSNYSSSNSPTFVKRKDSNSGPLNSNENLQQTQFIQENNERSKQDEITKIKMRKIQEKMQMLVLKKKKQDNEKETNQEESIITCENKSLPTKLPALQNRTNKEFIQERGFDDNNTKDKVKKAYHMSNVHLPPIVFSAKNSNSKDSDKNTLLMKTYSTYNSHEITYLKKILLTSSTKQQKVTFKRSCSLTPEKFAVKLSSLSEYANLFTDEKPIKSFIRLKKEQSSNDVESLFDTLLKKEDLHKKRPKTSPFVGNINFNVFYKSLWKKLFNKQYSAEFYLKTSSPNNNNNNNNSNNNLILSSQKLPPLSSTKPKRLYCSFCRKKLGISSIFECRCGLKFCSIHRYSEAHNCLFDYKAEGKRLLKLSNPLICAPKLPKI